MDAIASPVSPVPVAEAEPTVSLTPLQKSEKLTKEYVLWSVGGGMIPLPLVDIAAITVAQLRLVAKISGAYGVPYSDNRAKNLIAPLVTSIGIVPVGAGVVTSLLKWVPVVGTAVGVASMPVVAGATTYAVGKVFISHFEAGGTLLDFDPDKMKAYYAKMFAEGKQVAEKLKETDAAAAKKK